MPVVFEVPMLTVPDAAFMTIPLAPTLRRLLPGVVERMSGAVFVVPSPMIRPLIERVPAVGWKA